ncbi:MAG: NifB/NifX family molybdenum-iron cluster-binding protein [Candidatus Aminicenantes bacterium]
MKLAISTEGNMVSAHFGRCPTYTIVEITEGQVKKREQIENPGHSPGFLPNYLSDMGVSCVIAGGMGSRAQDLFRQKNIEPLIGVQGSIDEVINKFINQELEKGEDLCDHRQSKPHSHPHSHHQPSEKSEIDPNKRIGFTAQGESIEDEIDPRFGRASFYIIYDPKTKSIESLENPNKDLMQGVGPRSVQFLSENNVEVLFTGQIGPNAQRVLQASNIKAITGASGKIKDLLEKYNIEVK